MLFVHKQPYHSSLVQFFQVLISTNFFICHLWHRYLVVECPIECGRILWSMPRHVSWVASSLYTTLMKPIVLALCSTIYTSWEASFLMANFSLWNHLLQIRRSISCVNRKHWIPRSIWYLTNMCIHLTSNYVNSFIENLIYRCLWIPWWRKHMKIGTEL